VLHPRRQTALAPRFYPPGDHPNQPTFPLLSFLADKMSSLQGITRSLPAVVRDPLVALLGQVRCSLMSNRVCRGGDEEEGPRRRQLGAMSGMDKRAQLEGAVSSEQISSTWAS